MWRFLQDNLILRCFAPLGLWLDRNADAIIAVITHRWTRGAGAWLIAGFTAWMCLYQAWHAFDNGNYEDGNRADGNYGHSTIDFGGQWMMGAMLLEGHGRQLYHRAVQREVLRDAYPRDRQDPRSERSDGDKLMSYFMGTESVQAGEVIGSFLTPIGGGHAWDATAGLLLAAEGWTPERVAGAEKPRIGGPLYPPINALVYAPLALKPPHESYRIAQVLNLLWALAAGCGVRYLTRGRIWVAVAVFIIVLYPGFKGSIHLGQNAALTLAILVWGWAFIARGHDVAGGLVWGLLAFKPVWAAAFFLVPFVTFRWRTCLAMLGMGVALALATVPFVGIQPWFDWLKVGQEASALYKVDYNWVHLSRDVLGIPRRYLLDFNLPNSQRDNLAAGLVGWAMFGACLGFTLLLPLIRHRDAQAGTGTTAGFLLLGAWLSCFHFMYYDVLLTALPLFVLLAEPRRYLEPILFAVTPLQLEPASGLDTYYAPRPADQEPPEAPLLQPALRHVWVLSRLVPNVLLLLLFIEHFFPHIGLQGTVSWRWGVWPLKATTVVEGDTSHVLVYQRVAELAGMRVTTSLYDGGEPWDTYCIIALWLWCGLLWIRSALRAAPAAK